MTRETHAEPDCRRPPRVRRRVEGIVAQYIHELSERHREAGEELPLRAVAASAS
ncbi:MAG: hypothetical protein ACJ76X_08225 [Solirubrobacteraceae bacterium]|jgi:hypothetical protein